ncbi:hypothetical protein CERZMDRAFT_63112 [Cercospora zeae-maydis SCOH1-5]|uniref:aminodeoxychorismate synthase n=1 Tax=Cercospora zeae-maydis SCOH1-5 TaxID=717836 RepID=A0A6A6F1E4_9PEZI|nr:hypothetical protein CERZMDRAFT_63112 [Cercospora zeae-maydis SCOH1-5]
MLRHRILFVDAYDSFSNSIVALLQAELPVTVESIKIDDARFVLNDKAFFDYLDGFDAVVAGPGPGHPANAKDIGLIGKLWVLPEKHLLPVLGICLGFQSLCLAFGAKIERLKEPRHGIMTMVDHCHQDIYADTGRVVATQYHSLHVTLGQNSSVDDWGSSNQWQKSEECPDLVPLSWTAMSLPNGPTLMGVRHGHKPLWGVQYHPESICTNKEGQKLMRNWWVQAYYDAAVSFKLPTTAVHWTQIDYEQPPDVASIMEMLRGLDVCEHALLLESGTRDGRPVNPETGRFSIIGLPTPSSKQYRFSTSDRYMEVTSEGSSDRTLLEGVADAFARIEDILLSNKATSGPPNSPFWGGLIGFISYEAGLQSIDVPPVGASLTHPDLWFVMAERSIVVDHVDHVIYVQTIRASDDEWLRATRCLMLRLTSTNPNGEHLEREKLVAHLEDGPEENEYCRKVLDCQANLRAGESYELCLTDQSTLRTSAEPWAMYRQLRDRNPAPFSTFMRLQHDDAPGISIVGSSPERFLSWSRSGKCQFRPIKGTVKKTPGVTRAKAEELLASPKERAENLMIVDLIRHDLAGVKGIAKVDVPKLMAVEEYQTVFQLVSVIEGTVAGGSGISALAASLPPGSMTGAPKKRSCELLSEIEGGKPRGLYSGVLGYLDVGGGGDFSVVIRTAFKWDDEGDDWHVGAGGAITALSDPEAEWEEMLTKRESVLTALL